MNTYRVTGRAAVLASEMYLDGEVPAARLLDAADYLRRLEQGRDETVSVPLDLAEARMSEVAEIAKAVARELSSSGSIG
jgi:hypothetical protein